MGNKTNSSVILHNMLIIGGCELSLERNAYNNIEMIDFKNRQIYELKQKLMQPARGCTAHIINNQLWVVGGCRASKDHIKDV